MSQEPESPPSAQVPAHSGLDGKAASPDPARAERDARLAQCLREAAAGSAKAFEHFYDETVGLAHSLIRRMVGDTDAEDVLAEGYFQAWREAARFDPERGSAMTWLLTLLRSRALDLLRRRRSDEQPLDEEAAAERPDDANPGPAELLHRARQAGCLRQALAGLSGQERWVLGLAYYSELPHARIAEATQLPLGTVKSLILRAQHKLRAALAETAAPSRSRPAK